jgi:hypothetical protein
MPERVAGTASPATPTTIDVVYDRLIDVAQQQLDDQSNRDGKIVQVFAAASVVLGLAGLSATTASSNPTAVALLLLFAGVAYAGVAITTGIALWARDSETLRLGSSLLETEWTEPPEQVKLRVIARFKPAYEKDRVVLTQKAHLLSAGIIAAGIEVAFVAAAVIVRVVAS